MKVLVYYGYNSCLESTLDKLVRGEKPSFNFQILYAQLQCCNARKLYPRRGVREDGGSEGRGRERERWRIHNTF